MCYFFSLMYTSHFHFGNFLCICSTCLIDFAFEFHHRFKQRNYLVKKKDEMESLLAKQKEKINFLTQKNNTDRIDSGGNPEETLNNNSVMNNFAILREKEKSTFAKSMIQTMLFKGISKRDNTINTELQGMFLKI